VLTQIYEITSPTEARSLSLIGVDHVGVLVGDGRFPREQPLSAATEIAATILPPSKLSALFLYSDLELIVQWRRSCGRPSCISARQRSWFPLGM